MANVFNDGIWILDTESNTELLLGITHRIRVKKLEWFPSAGAETLLIKDQFGKVRVSRTSLAASPAGDDFIDYDKPLEINGFVLHTLTAGGTLYVYLD